MQALKRGLQLLALDFTMTSPAPIAFDIHQDGGCDPVHLSEIKFPGRLGRPRYDFRSNLGHVPKAARKVSIRWYKLADPEG